MLGKRKMSPSRPSRRGLEGVLENSEPQLQCGHAPTDYDATIGTIRQQPMHEAS